MVNVHAASTAQQQTVRGLAKAPPRVGGGGNGGGASVSSYLLPRRQVLWQGGLLAVLLLMSFRIHNARWHYPESFAATTMTGTTTATTSSTTTFSPAGTIQAKQQQEESAAAAALAAPDTQPQSSGQESMPASTAASSLSSPSTPQHLPPMQIFLRSTFDVRDQKHYLYCDFLRSLLLFWPLDQFTNRIILLLDNEKQVDHDEALQMQQLFDAKFPEIDLRIEFEDPPANAATLFNFSSMFRHQGYNRQLWSSFYIDKAVASDRLIVFMDADAILWTPHTWQSIVDDRGRPRARATTCQRIPHVWKQWREAGELATGIPFVGDFMTYFPFYIYPSTIRNAREHILRHHNTTDFGEVFAKIHKPGFQISPVNVHFNYAYHFERDKYHWDLDLCPPLEEYNQRIQPPFEKIRPADAANRSVLSRPSTGFHQKNTPELTKLALTGYCLAMDYAREVDSALPRPEICLAHNKTSREAMLRESFPLFHFDLQIYQGKANNFTTPCDEPGSLAETECLQRLDTMYREYAQEYQHDKSSRLLDWSQLERVVQAAHPIPYKQCHSFT